MVYRTNARREPAVEEKRRRFPWKPVAIVALLLLGLAPMAPYIYHDIHEASLVKNGVHVKGRVIDLRDTGDRFNDDPVAEVTVELTTLEGATVRGKVLERVSAVDAVWLRPGETVDVWYSQKDPTDIAIRWGQGK